MASVQELIAAAEYQQPKNGLMELLDLGVGGYKEGLGIKDARVEIAKKILEKQQMQQAIDAQNKMQKEIEEMMGQQQEAAVQDGLKSVQAPKKLALPANKLKVEIEQDSNGQYSRKFKVVEPKTPNSLDEIIAQKVNSGEMTIEEAYKMKNQGQGITPSLDYQMKKDSEAKEIKKKAQTVPGYDKTGTVEIDEIESRNLRSGVAEFETFKTGLSEYKALIEKHGTTEPTDRNIQGQLSAYAKNLQLKIKNLAQLGVLSASDIPFIEEQIPGPGMFKTKEGMLGALTTAEKLMQEAIDNKLKVSGYSKAGGNTGAPKAGDIVDGYEFKGGDPADQNNWEKQ